MDDIEKEAEILQKRSILFPFLAKSDGYVKCQGLNPAVTI